MLQETINQIKTDEGLDLNLYTCTAGKTTIGFGTNLENGITNEEAEYLLKNRVKTAILELIEADSRDVENSFFIEQPEQIQSVLINMAFNLGVNGLLTFKKTLRLIVQREYPRASIEMLDSKWARQVGDRANRLSKIVLDCNPSSPNGSLFETLGELSNEPYKGRYLYLIEELKKIIQSNASILNEDPEETMP